MHRPDNRFTALQDLTDTTQGEHTLIDPVQMDDVGFLELAQTSDIRTSIGDIDLKEVGSGEVEMTEYNETFPQEIPTEPPGLRQWHDSQCIRVFVTYQHLHLDTIVVQRLHQTVGGYSRPPRAFTRIYDKYFHTSFYMDAKVR